MKPAASPRRYLPRLSHREDCGMPDEDARLQENAHLLFLLEHYCASEDRETWLDRVMQIAELDRAAITGLHGELLAYGWIEQNTGVLPLPQMGACAGSYRSSAAGRKALTRYRRALAGEMEEAA
jgi:hypothetical protein